ncbi:hypothetical protein [Streptomyces sp. NPDC050164]|uniref:hypothetical protein n=1 Tax=Streptomyces sp. NPDC050164 TaxID=3365605 RepID=UPI0037BABE64
MWFEPLIVRAEAWILDPRDRLRALWPARDGHGAPTWAGSPVVLVRRCPTKDKVRAREALSPAAGAGSAVVLVESR